MIHIRLTALFIASALVFVTWRLVRRKRLKISYALLWLSVGIAFVLITIVPGAIEFLSRVTGLYYITALLLIGFTFLTLLLLHFSSVISKLTYENRMLAHRMAFLEEELHRDKNYEPMDTASCRTKANSTLPDSLADFT